MRGNVHHEALRASQSYRQFQCVSTNHTYRMLMFPVEKHGWPFHSLSWHSAAAALTPLAEVTLQECLPAGRGSAGGLLCNISAHFPGVFLRNGQCQTFHLLTNFQASVCLALF